MVEEMSDALGVRDDAGQNGEVVFPIGAMSKGGRLTTRQQVRCLHTGPESGVN